MPSITKRLIYWLWPPYEAWVTDKEITKRNREDGEKARLGLMLDELRNSLPRDADYEQLEQLEKMAIEIKDSENNRKEVLESKASPFLSGVGIAVAIISFAPTLLADEKAPLLSAVVLGFLCLLAIVFLLVSGLYAVKVRRVTPFALPSSQTFLDSLKNSRWRIEERIVSTIGQVIRNEETLVRKSNYLSVAEDLFMRGLFLIWVTAIASLAIKLMARLK